jgi:hypothetical protein
MFECFCPSIAGLKDAFSDVLNSIEQGISSEKRFVTQGRSKDTNVPLPEVRMSKR